MIVLIRGLEDFIYTSSHRYYVKYGKLTTLTRSTRPSHFSTRLNPSHPPIKNKKPRTHLCATTRMLINTHILGFSKMTSCTPTTPLTSSAVCATWKLPCHIESISWWFSSCFWLPLYPTFPRIATPDSWRMSTTWPASTYVGPLTSVFTPLVTVRSVRT
jgi:hypothetical protein